MNNQYISTNALTGDYIAHFRTKGSKNGVRLYQNEDGTYTELGKERRRKNDSYDYNRAVKAERRYTRHISSISSDKLFTRDKQGKSPAESISGNVLNITRDASNIARIVSSTKKSSRSSDAKIKRMSDNELRERVNRLNLEKQYRSLTYEDTSRGKIAAEDVLSIAGSVVTIGAGGVAIYATLKDLKKG